MDKDLFPTGMTVANIASNATQSHAQKALDLKNRNMASEQDIEKASSGFEALLLHQMLTEMWETVEHTGLFGEEGNEAQIYRDMFNQAVSDEVAKGKGIGVKEYLQKELSKDQKHLKEEA